MEEIIWLNHPEGVVYIIPLITLLATKNNKQQQQQNSSVSYTSLWTFLPPAGAPSNVKMQQATSWLHLLLLLLLHRLTSVDLEEVDKVPVEVIVDSSPCSATCGLGMKTQTLCLLKDGQAAMEDSRSKDGAEVS